MAEDVYPTFPSEFRGAYEKIPPGMLQTPEGDANPLLLDTKGHPVARVVTIERRDINANALNKVPKDEAALYLDLLHQRDEQGNVALPGGNYVHFTTSPLLPDQEAVDDVFKMLTHYGVYQTEYNAPGAQGALEIGAPLVAGTVGGVLGGPLGAAAGAGLGSLGANLARPYLNPAAVADNPDVQSVAGVATDVATNTAFGGLGEVGLQGTRALKSNVLAPAIKRLTVKGVDLSPEEAALFAPGGAYDQAAALTGQRAYGRVGNYVRGALREIDRYVSGALFARTSSEEAARSLQKNKDAYLTSYVNEINATGQTANVGERVLNWIDTDRSFSNRAAHPNTVLQGAIDVQQGMYAYAQHLADASGAPHPVETDVVLDWLNARGGMGGLRLQDRQLAAQRILSRIKQDAGAETVTTSNAERLAETAGDTTTTIGTTNRTRINPQGQTTNLAEEQGTVVRTPTPTGRIVETQREVTNTAQQERFPLDGLLNTVEASSGTVSNQIDIGRGQQLVQAAQRAARSENDPAVKTALEGFATRMQRQVDTALRAMGPDVQEAFTNARTFTAQMYRSLRNETIQADVVNALNENPESFAGIATHPRNTHIIQAMYDAFHFGGRIDPAMLPPGTTLPAALRDSGAFFDNFVLPEIQFQTLKELAFDPVMHDRLQAVAASSTPTREFLAQNRLLTLAPGKITNMRAQLGEETFNMIFGGKGAGDRWIQLDQFLQSGQPKGEVPLSLAVVMGQVGGASLAATAAYKLAHGQIVQGISGLVGAGFLIAGAPLINRAMLKPELFERLVLGLSLPAKDPRKGHFLGQMAAQTASYLAGPSIKRYFGPADVIPSGQ